MSNLSVFSNANLPAVSTLVDSLRQLKSTESSNSIVILKMDKVGRWVFGSDQTEAQEGSLWAVNPFSFVHGFIAWGEGVVLGEKMTPVSNPLPELDAAPAQAKRGWEQQIGFSLRCLNGDDKGVEARFTTTSRGGKKAVQLLATALADQVEKNREAPVPVLTLDSEHYPHKEYGRVYVPIFSVVKWINMELQEELAEAVEDIQPEELAAPAVGRRRRAV
jgi:hypothetical protein